MASNDLVAEITAAITIKLDFELNFWQAVKLRIAGKGAVVLIEHVREHMQSGTARDEDADDGDDTL
jgi:hypothetical protein